MGKYYHIYGIRKKVSHGYNGENWLYIGMSKYNNPSYMGSGSYLWSAYNKYGLDKYEKDILAICSSESEMRFIETILIEAFRPKYNLAAGGKGSPRAYVSEEKKKEWNKNLSISKKRFWINVSEEWKQDHGRKLSLTLKKGYKENPQRRIKVSKTQLERWSRPGEKERMSKIHQKSHQNNPDRAIRQGEFLRRFYKENPEARTRMSQSMKQAHRNDPTISLRQSESMKKYCRENPEHSIRTIARNKARTGEKRSPETRKRMSEARKAYFKRKRELENEKNG